MKMKVVCKQVISSCNQTGGKSWLCGVITGVPLEVTMIELMRNIKGGNVIEAKRLQRNREGNKEESLSVMLRFESSGMLPSKEMIGYVSFQVREYVRAPLRCYNCQRYGHIASVCRAKRDVHIVGKNMSTENVEEVWKQNFVIVGGPIMWHMEGVKLERGQ